MVTAYLASNCWISTRSSIRDCVMSVDLTALHYKIDIPCNADVRQWIAGHGDDVREVALGDTAQVRLVDQVGGDDGSRAEHGGGRHAPIDESDEFIGVLAVRDRRSVGADGDLDPGLVSGLDRRPRLGEHLGGLVLQLLR